MLWLFKTYALSAGMYASQIYLVYKISGAWQCFQQGWAIRTSDTFNTVNTQYAYDMIPYFVQFGSANFDPKWTRFAPKSPRTFPTLFQYICVINYITALEAHWKAVVGTGIALKSPKTAINGKSCNRIISEGVDGANVLKCDFFWCRPYLINKTRWSKKFEVNRTTSVVWVGFPFKFWDWIFTF